MVGALLAIFALVTIVRFFAYRTYLPSGTTIADIPVADLTVDEALQQTEALLASPITVTYGGKSAQFQPAGAGFALDTERLRPQLEAVIEANSTLETLANHLLLKPRLAYALNAEVTVDTTALDTFFGGLAAGVDQPMAPARIASDTLALTPGAAGTAINLEDSRDALRRVLAKSAGRELVLEPDVIPARGLSVRDIDALVAARVANFAAVPGNVAGVYVKDLGTGDEFALNGDVAFSAPGWLRWGIAVELVRTLGVVDATTLAPFVSGNETPNAALTRIGAGDAEAGTMRVNETLRTLGLVNTFVAQPYSWNHRPPTIVTPANARGDVDAHPDANAQSTPVEVGLLLEMLDQCRRQSGQILVAYEQQFSPKNCDALLGAFGQSQTGAVIKTPSAGDTIIQGATVNDNTHGVAGLVRSGGRSYVVVVALYSPTEMEWDATALVMGEITRAAHAVFTASAPTPDRAIGAAP